MAARKPGFRHNEDTRAKIKAQAIINRLHSHVIAKKPIMDSSQVSAAKALLNKVLPDLKAHEIEGTLEGQLTINIVKYAGSNDSK